MRILAIGAHPDDLEIFVFGSLMAWKAMGADLTLAVATDGAAGGTGDPVALAAQRRQEAIAGAAALGVEPRFLDFPDGALFPDPALAAAVKALMTDCQPDLIVTHAPNDYHADHRALSQGVSLAASFAAPVLWMETMGGTGFIPTHWVDTTDHRAAKHAAIMAHASQKPAVYAERADRQAAFRAGECNQPEGARAEAFRFEPRFPFADVRALLPPAPPVRAIPFGKPGYGR